MKNKFLSFVGMRLGGRQEKDTLTAHLSPTNHPLKQGVWKVITMIILLLALSVGNMWGVNVSVAYTYESSASKATMATNDVFSAASNPTVSSNGTLSANSGMLRCTVTKSKSTTVTFTFTAKTAIEVSSFTFNSYAGSDKVKSATVDYYKNSETPVNVAVTFDKSSASDKTITPDTDPSEAGNQPITMAQNDVLTIKVNLTNSDSSNDRPWNINTITLSASIQGQLAISIDGAVSRNMVLGSESAIGTSVDNASGSETYQWYKTTSSDTECESGSSISGAESSSFTPDEGAAGTYYYYCVVTDGLNTAKTNLVTVLVAAPLTGWVVFDGLVDTEKHTSPITVGTVSLAYETSDVSYVDVSGKTNSTGRPYNKGMQISKSTGGYLKFTIPTNYTATFKWAFSGTGSRTIMLASAKINSTSADGYIATLTTAVSSTNIVAGEYDTPLTAGDYYICEGGSGNWQIDALAFTLAATAPAVDYTVTINPNGGAYASTPDGWTYDNVNYLYTKTVASGTSFSAPDGLTQTGKDLSGWKDGSSNSITFPVTISSDITFVAQWTDHVASSNADLSALSVAGCTLNETFAKSTTAYTIDLPFGSSMPAVGDVTATKDDSNAKTPAVSISGNVITIACEAEDGTKKNYTITVTIPDSKLLDLVWKTGQSACSGAGSQSAVIKSDNAAVSTYIKPITFANVEGSGDDATEGSSLNTGKKAGNTIIIQTQPGYLFTTMSFYGKIESDDVKCQISVDGGANWSDLASTSSGDATYCNVVTSASTSDIRIKGCGTKGTWIRNMQLTVTTGCTPKTIAWTTAPAAEYEVGKSGYAIAASANNGTVTYASSGDAITVNASTGALTINSLTNDIDLSASVGAGDGTLYCASPASVVKEEIKTYYLVQFDPQNGESVSSTKYYSGDAAISLPSAPSYAGHTFQGWFDAATGGSEVTSAVTPTASRTIYAQWEADCAGPTITVQPASANYLTGRTPSALSCTATAGNSGELTYAWYSCDDAERTNPVALGGAPTPSTAAAGTFYYYCVVTEAGCAVMRTSDVATITVADKDPVCIIKATPTTDTEATADGAYKGSVAFKSSGKKLSSKYDYVAVQLMAGKSFLATDKIVLNQTADLGGASDITKFYIFTEVPADGKTYVTVDNASPKKGDNEFTMPAEMEGESALYIGRVDSKCNPTVGYLAVYRVMAPELVSLSVNSIAATKSGSTFTVTLPAATNLASLSLTEVIAWNAPAASNSKQVTTNEGAWAWGNNTYVLTDKDGDATSYTITLNQAAAIKKVQISGTLSVQEGSTTTLTATVIDTNDAPADIQDVTWTSDATSVATVDNGVVTGKTVGTAHITATSVADGTKYATVEVTVTENLCREWNTPNNISDATISVGKVRMTHPDCGTSSKSAYSGASNVNMLKIEAQKGSTSKYFDIYFSDGALFESLELGLATGSSTALNYAIAFCSASTFDEEKIISVEEYPANPNNVAQALNNIVLPDGTKSVRLYKSFQVDSETTKGSGSSIYIYHVAACKKEIVAVSGVTLNKTALSLPKRSSETLVATVTPSNATDKSVTWTSDDETVATVDANGLVKAVGTGTANITATSVADGTKSASCAVTVTAFDCAGFTGDLFTLEVTTTSSQTYNIGNGTEVELLAAHVDVEGGHAYAGRDGSTKGDVSGYITSSSSVACIRLQKANSMQNYLKVVLDDCTLRNSDVISFTQRAGETRSISITKTAEFSNTITTGDEYTVTQGDGLAGTNTFYIWYDGNQRVDVKTLTVTRVALVDITSVSLADMTIRTTKSRAPELTTDPANGTILSVEYEIIGSTPASTIDPNTGVVTAGDVEEVFTVQATVNGDKVATCEVTVVTNLTQLDVDESTVWDFSKAGVTGNFTDEVLANVDGITLDASQFNARQLVGSANNIASTYFQGTMLSFNATVPGLITVMFTSGNNNPRVLKVYDNDENLLASWNYSGAATENESVEVPAGKVTLRSFQGDAANNVRITTLKFYALDDAYTRNDVAQNALGTVCLPNGYVATGADMYQMAGVNEYRKFVFDEVEVMEPGVPYLFQVTSANPVKFYKTPAAAVGAAGTSNGMVGTFNELYITAGTPDIYYFSGQKFYSVANRTTDLRVRANRAYVDLSEPHPVSAPPRAGARRITIGVEGEQTATGMDALNASDAPVKVIINGELFILRGEKMYDATGRLVK